MPAITSAVKMGRCSTPRRDVAPSAGLGNAQQSGHASAVLAIYRKYGQTFFIFETWPLGGFYGPAGRANDEHAGWAAAGSVSRTKLRVIAVMHRAQYQTEKSLQTLANTGVSVVSFTFEQL
jgi:hypothetical protein